tara:strand:+ start:12 stop:863 length:852 start_codon:yes stop_codon:yes gene_type:complete
MVTDEFPFFSRCLKGDFVGGGPGIVDCEDVPPGAPCCGDGICGGPETENNCPADCASGDIGPSLINFAIYADTVNTYQDSINIGYIIEAEDTDNYLSNYILRLIINGGPNNGGEMLESSGDFNSNLMSSSIANVIEIPQGTTEGRWNIRIILANDINAISNIGPNQLENQNFQNHIYVYNSQLGKIKNNIPIAYFLSQNYPNPFNPNTSIKYNLPENTNVEISVYNLMGILVKNLINTNQNSGYKSVIWDGTNNNGEMVSGGIYFYIIKTNTFSQTRKMILLK